MIVSFRMGDLAHCHNPYPGCLRLESTDHTKTLFLYGTPDEFKAFAATIQDFIGPVPDGQFPEMPDTRAADELKASAKDEARDVLAALAGEVD